MSSAGNNVGASRDYRQLFHDSYLRCVVGDQDGFFQRFYQLFIAADREVSRIFANTDMDRQITMLQESLLYLIHFANSKIANERLHRIATYHGSTEMNIPSRMFDLWLDRLVATVRERDAQFDSHVELAWRIFLAPGIALFKSHCSP